MFLLNTQNSNLDLLYSEVKERGVVPYWNETLGSHAAHTGSQTPVQLDHDKFVQQAPLGPHQRDVGDPLVGIDLGQTEICC